MSEFSINHEDPNFDDINDSLAGNVYEKDEENKIDGYNNFASLAQISTGADSERFKEEKREDVKESNLEVVKISQIERIKIEKSKTEDVAIKKEEEKEVEEDIEVNPIKIEENLTKSTKSETKNESTKIGKNFILKRDLHWNHGPSNNEINLINNKQNLHNQNQVHNNQKSYIVYVFENKINFPEKELFFGAFRKKENIEDFFPKDIIYILIGEEDLQNGDHKYYYENILINEIYSILKRKDEKIFILIDIEK